MPNFLIALIIVIGGLWLIRKAARMPAGQGPKFFQKIAGGGLIAFSGLLALRGGINAAVPVFLFGLGLLGKNTVFPNGFGWNTKSAGQKSRVETAFLSMELDHDSGAMDGEVKSGQLRGRKLSSLDDSELSAFYGLCAGAPDQSRPLLEAWLDRNAGEWRARWGAGGAKSGAPSGNMSRDEAYSVLGLKAGATEDEIRTAHKRLMKEFHPDRGGSDYLAAKINQAKDVLLG